MSENKTSISKAKSYQDIGAYWDNHDVDEVWEDTETVNFDVNIKSERTYYAIEHDLSKLIVKIAHDHGVSPETLLNLWVQEKLKQNVGNTKSLARHSLNQIR